MVSCSGLCVNLQCTVLSTAPRVSATSCFFPGYVGAATVGAAAWWFIAADGGPRVSFYQLVLAKFLPFFLFCVVNSCKPLVFLWCGTILGLNRLTVASGGSETQVFAELSSCWCWGIELGIWVREISWLMGMCLNLCCRVIFYSVKRTTQTSMEWIVQSLSPHTQ